MAPKFQPFSQNDLGKASNVAVYAALCPTSHLSPWVSWAKFDQTLWASTPAKASYSSNESYFCCHTNVNFVSHKRNWNVQDNPYLDWDRIHWCDFRVDGTLKLTSLYEKSALTENLPYSGWHMIPKMPRNIWKFMLLLALLLSKDISLPFESPSVHLKIYLF